LGEVVAADRNRQENRQDDPEGSQNRRGQRVVRLRERYQEDRGQTEQGDDAANRA
jgi:hypothetical protein